MPNSIKYSTDSQTLALKKGNFYIGVGDVDKGPTSNTGYWNGITPPAGGYTIYLNKVSGGASIYVAYSDTELINLTNKIAGTSYSTVNECLNYFAGQSDKLVTNKDYPTIITNGLVLNLDASYAPSYPKNGTTWYDISSGGNNGTLVNGTAFSTDNGGSMVFDGADDRVVTSTSTTYTNTQTWMAWVKKTSSVNAYNMYMGRVLPYFAFRTTGLFHFSNRIGSTQINLYSPLSYSDNVWYHTSFTTEYNNPNTTMKMYINGVLVNSVSALGTQYNYVDPYTFTIGDGRDTSTWYPFNGYVSMVSVYDRTLSADEILQNYNATAFLGSQYNPANSAADILSANPSATDGYYWINTSLGPRQLYCIMSLGGWMGVTSEISPQIDNLSTTTTWETNTNRRLQSGNSQTLNVSLVEGNCGAPTHYQLQSPNSVGISYTQTMLLIQRITTIGQCSSISGVVANGYYSGPEYSGTYTSNGMCLWGDGIFANACCSAQNVSGLQPYWVMFGSGANQSLRYEVRCAGGSGQHYHMWFVK